MREIKFRAWKKNGGLLKWETGFSVSQNGKVYSLDGGYNGSSDITDQVILMQFTGLLDKNGKEIFEGDILKDGTVSNMCVVWSERHASWCLRSMSWMFDHYFGEGVNSGSCEIIGNIHESPNILKERE